MACVIMNSIADLRAEIVRLEKLLSEKDEALEKMNNEISSLVKFILSKHIRVNVMPNSTPDGQDVVPKSKF
jgi:predicted  nucleic acid-binding Zn-ribbon protein